MNGWDVLDALLGTDPRDVGCDAAMEAMAVYADVVLAGGDPEVAHPGVSAHLVACGPCAVDLAALLAAIRALGAQPGPQPGRGSGQEPGGGAPTAPPRPR